jgi:uncharacterized protein (TIGR02147 family)
MGNAIFKYQDYKALIRAMITNHSAVRGYQGRMSEAVGCPKSYFSQVINSKAHLSQEQAMRLCLFWSLNESETEFFLELVNLAKTNFPPLMERIKKRLQVIQAQAENLADRFTKARFLNREKEAYYYSAWYWSAIHILVGIKGYQTTEAIARFLKLSPQTVSETLSGLEAMKLVKSDGKKWETVPGHLHLKKESPMLPIHHANWRQEAVINSRKISSDNLHYTVIGSHSFADFERLKQLFLNSLDNARSIIDPSPNEELTCLCLDFFRV